MGLFGETPKPQSIRRAGLELKCRHCGGGEFYEGEAQLGTQGLNILSLEWLGKTARYYSCSRCGHMEWFMPVPQTE